MQLGVLNLLLGIPNGAMAGNGQGKADGGALPDLFSQLLNDPAQDGQSQQQPGGQLLGDVTPGALTAQEIGAADATAEENLNDLLNKEITPDDASALLDKLAAFGDADAPAVQPLKNLLTTIKDSKTPQTVGAVMAQLHANPEHAPIAPRLAAWMKENLSTEKQKESSTQESATDEGASDGVSPVVQSLQASIFRDDEHPAEKPKEKTTDYVEIVPLSQPVAATPAWIKNLTKPQVRADLDAAIPALSTPAAASDDAELPEVTLPTAKLPAAELGDKAEQTLEKLRPLSSDITAQNATKAAPTDSVPTPVIAPHVQAADHKAAAAPASMHGPVNHAPVAEQVHVAVTRGKQDGIDQLTLQLDPVDLGRVEVKMHTNNDGHTQLSFLVDKAETLDSLSRDARSLERSLQDAGIKADAGSMQFNLRQQPQPQAQGDGQFGQRQPQWDNEPEENAVAPQASAISAVTKNYTITLHDGVDIHA
jgi:flagellar hook-length control protein FliK